ncbi:heavy-metal-associated domain-containing protein [Novosphingobium sp.]|uniref:heavy-metal-associated domain-containing protein n=1 Tax=Novosphingobium sp. TaxID=1874826 RepID=UPI00333E4591
MLGIGGAVVWAQIEGDRGIAPVASTGDFEVSGIEVNTTGASADEARNAGWHTATRLAWQKLWAQRGSGGPAPALDDGTLSGMVSAVAVEHEDIGPHRYIARLGVVFDRARMAGYLGLQGGGARSAPLLVIPLLYQGGVASVFETRTPWQKAWADFHTGESVIDYVRPGGGGADGLLIDAGQVGRRSRNWWRTILDQYGAEDVLIPIARLERQWPGGPVKGTFAARYGPDNHFLGAFELTAPSEDKVPAMLADAVRRIDGIYAQALAAGQLNPDPSLNSRPQIDPKLVASIVDKLPPPTAAARSAVPGVAVTSGSGPAATVYQIQFVSPDAGAVDATQAALRGVPGVQSAVPSSLALGGVSVMRVGYSGDLEALAAALRAQGWKVTQGSGALMIRR